MMVSLPFMLCLPAVAPASSLTPPAGIQVGHNTSGAILFFSYIFAALYFTSYIVLSIWQLQTGNLARSKPSSGGTSRYSQKPPRKADWVWHHGAFATFCALSLASFAVLSWNMLNFLIVSYLGWSAKHRISVHSRLHILVQFWQHIQHVWFWATGSHLFQTFAEELVSDPSQWKVVRVALIYSYTWNSWMSTLGHDADIPILWAYFVLDQILPVSFTQNLFCAALVQASSTASHSSRTASTGYANLFLRLLGLLSYCAALYWIPTTNGTVWFFPILFTLRMLLLTPYLVDRLTIPKQTPTRSCSGFTTKIFNYFLVALSVVALGSINVPEVRAPPQIPTAYLNTNYATAALSNDMVLGFVSGIAAMLLARK